MKQSIVRINLMPHREAKRQANQKQFSVRAILVALLGVAAVVLAATVIEQFIDAQRQRNEFIKSEIKVLDQQIAQIATLQQEIDGLKARQKAVEDLQADRNLPVYLFDELVRYIPEGVYLKSLKQDGLKINLVGLAQTQERVSELLRNFGSASHWIEAPELSEIKSVPSNRANEKLFEFNMTAMLKRQSKAAPAPAGKAVALPAPPKP